MDINKKRERLKQVIHEAIAPYLVRAILGGFETAILKALSDEGCVLKVERELPKLTYMTYGSLDLQASVNKAYESMQEVMLEAGYVAVESLIEEEK